MSLSSAIFGGSQMANDDYREQHDENRKHGLAARHETRVERANEREAYERGYRRARKEIADEMGLSHAWQVDDPRIHYVDIQIDKETYLGLLEDREEHSNEATEETK